MSRGPASEEGLAWGGVTIAEWHTFADEFLMTLAFGIDLRQSQRRRIGRGHKLVLVDATRRGWDRRYFY